ncbi:ABC1 kinase family protein [Amycolatopsis sp. NPDC059657]|uniref:ABC1 kinase family protein n=1 Tax=Amycolatopsis sp. NPDC059657 TaxID=3346899 RepID=UPI00366BD9E6
MSNGEPVPAGRLRRALPLAALAGRTAGDAVVAALQQRVLGAEGKPAAAQQRAANRYQVLLGRSRGVLMKAGQIISFMSINSPGGAYQTAFQKLQADAPPMDWEDAVSVLEAELGAHPDGIFAEFSRKPLAAASIGQVHRARTKDGRDVAVKVQYPGMEAAIAADLANVDLLTTFLRVRGVITGDKTQVDTRALVAEIGDRIGEEIDYRIEAANQAEFADAYRGHPVIRIPEIVPELSTRRVLTMDFVDGLGWQDAVERSQELRDRWGEVIYRFLWGSLRRFRIAYTDPHPGNYLFHEDGTVTFLDFGCVKRFTPEQVANLVAMEQAGVEGDADRLWRASMDLNSLTADPPTPAELLDWMSAQWTPMTAEQPFTYTPEYAAAVNKRMFSPFGEYGAVIRKMNMPPETLFYTRMDAGITAILGALRSTGHWAEIIGELDGAVAGGKP